MRKKEIFNMLIEYVMKDFKNRKVMLFTALDLYDKDGSNDILVFADIYYKNKVIGYWYEYSPIEFTRKDGPDIWLESGLSLEKFVKLNKIEVNKDKIVKAMLECI